ncbi:flagellar motor switch phosphatase FliY [Domibacillus sp. DTU_2020_1001157_1_SI_ALB_TIR_016]|uniref:flagellar motor switch phosphatase FliY n=1 Tax=Domibacillus sp. DTU_2020_1001157_1_SI_ALB_TIR_016 TaxID=3077789 RepID=UPI0028EF23E3|nr:flagellar motor switch phosphatase FliY [Domibacillus sp. DTU_2020_1001157_1_SI_ALB_TIR_016]WNS82432.1 flagellar motor switch phosphatase FliY [Domibacillus sp. DTU_2020_1001157_1_SI_ALB_TIR_016]
MMSDDMLSQEEIDALLRGGDSDDTEESATLEATKNVEEYLDAFEQDTLGEIGNISFGSSATALSSLLNQKVEITTPTVSVVEKSRLKDEFPHPYAAIEVQYTEGFAGANLLVIHQNDAAIIADLMLGGSGAGIAPDLGELQLSAVQEAMNQMMGSAATSMSTIFNKRVDISPPSISLLNLHEGEGEETIPEQELLVKISFRLTVGDLIDSNIMQLIPLQFGKQLVTELMNPVPQEAAPPPIQQAPVTKPAAAQAPPPPAELPSMPARPSQEPVYMGQNAGRQASEAKVETAVFSSFQSPQLGDQEARNLNMLFDIPLQVTVELGRTNRNVKDILELTSGSIIELDKLAGEPVDVLVNNRLIARGEVVVIEENFGVRITNIASPADRLKNLN